jgi:hypothetical protein
MNQRESKRDNRFRSLLYIHVVLCSTLPFKVLPFRCVILKYPCLHVTPQHMFNSFLQTVSEHGSSVASVAGSSASRLCRYCHGLHHLLVVVAIIGVLLFKNDRIWPAVRKSAYSVLYSITLCRTPRISLSLNSAYSFSRYADNRRRKAQVSHPTTATDARVSSQSQ